MIEAEKSVYRDDYTNITVERDGELEAVLCVTMNRPEKRNALSLSHMRELIEVFRTVETDASVRAVILAGNGPAFCAGHDLGEMVGKDHEFYRETFDVCTELMTLVQGVAQPVIAEVHSIATAAGCQLAATCDLVVASEEARFATPGVRIGLFCSTPMVALSRAVGQKKSMEMLLTGDFVGAEEAERIGLVNRVVPKGDLRETSRQFARKVCEASPLVVGIGKEAFYRQRELPTAEAYAYTKEVMSHNATLRDAQEGMGAFLEKRRPEWTGS
ncbi:Enoyl-CoA hydratase/carnithine racemase [Rubrobacter radiotolerans]|uniref:Enoyl-CoA hydratase domain-containing protein 3, mitochondrial n=1 Tax=Rubrobacter radiotolerans TaxID=42256 RepID=A0A023X4K3_RUBRA|nr:enoyl-CoA hydratase [Rubrobacter radiotolerans]AHY47116.1 Enoyl-CoA hydratase/carnithine racemase [Rubrobacter radiotolerans]MDX5894521.1 enoyl-CoA hydratase [Rubrobacter radiotolerans]SMC06181.1 short chain enoyl-CoA hydratase [Rubrobacter radiotolerans DSM 5868]